MRRRSRASISPASLRIGDSASAAGDGGGDTPPMCGGRSSSSMRSRSTTAATKSATLLSSRTFPGQSYARGPDAASNRPARADVALVNAPRS